MRRAMRARHLLLGLVALSVGLAAWLAGREILPQEGPTAPPTAVASRERGPEAAAHEAPTPALRGRAETDAPATDGEGQDEEAAPPEEGIPLRVTDPDGAPLADGLLRISARASGFRSVTVVSVENGWGARPEGPFEGGAEAWITVPPGATTGFARTRAGPFASPDGLPDTITVGRGLDITGRVVGPGAEGVANARVSVRAALPVEGSRPRVAGEATTDGEGAFRIRGLADVDYELSVKAPRGYAPATALAVHGGDADVEVVLAKRPTCRVTVLDAGGQPLEHARVTVGGNGYLTDGAGVTTVIGFEAGVTGRLWVRPPRDRQDLLPSMDSTWASEDTTIRLEAAYTIAGRVVASGGRLRAATVRAASVERAGWWDREVDEDGRFVVPGLTAGEYELSVVSVDGQDLDPERIETVVAPAGARNVVLPVDLGLETSFVVRGLDGDPPPVAARLIDEARPWVVHESRLESNGRVRFRATSPEATYTLWIRGLPDDHCVLATGLAGGARKRVVHASEGATLEGRVVYPEGTKPMFLLVEAERSAVSLSAPLFGTASFTFRGVPEGKWRVSAFHVGADFIVRGACDAWTGEEAVLRLEREER